jgi:release factor glutamine methyltransferase
VADDGRLLRDVLHDAVRLLSASSALAEDAHAEGAAFSGDEAAREARWLVAAVLDMAPGELGRRLSTDQRASTIAAATIDRAARRRATGEPMAYCVGTAPFRHLVLQVDRRVLIPRPETEIVVGEALRLTANQPGGIAVDIGTGSGAIALSLATEGRFSRVLATDLSDDALAVAAANAALVAAAAPYAAPVEFLPGADLAPLRGIRARVIVSNPPYIAYSEAAALPRSVRDWEPTVALVAADQGMACYAAILAGAHALLEPFGWVVFEVDARRAQQTAALATTQGYHQVAVVRDLTGRDRVVLAQHVPA